MVLVNLYFLYFFKRVVRTSQRHFLYFVFLYIKQNKTKTKKKTFLFPKTLLKNEIRIKFNNKYETVKKKLVVELFDLTGDILDDIMLIFLLSALSLKSQDK